MFLCHQKSNFFNRENGVTMPHSVFWFCIKKIPLDSQNCCLGSSSWKHYFWIFFVHDLHVQCRSICGKFAYSANLGKPSTLAKVSFILKLSFVTFRNLAVREVSWKISLIREKATSSSASLLPAIARIVHEWKEQKIMWTSGLHEVLPRRQFENIMAFFTVAYKMKPVLIRMFLWRCNLWYMLHHLSITAQHFCQDHLW